MTDVPNPPLIDGGADRAPLVPGFVAADLTQRVLGRLLDAVVAVVVAYGLPLLALTLYRSPETLIGYVVLMLVVAVVMLVLPFLLSSLVGYALLGLRFVDVRTGRPSGGKVVGKYLLEGLLPFVGMVIAAATLDQHQRTWYDRFVGVQLVRWRDRDASVAGELPWRQPSTPPREAPDVPGTGWPASGPAGPSRPSPVPALPRSGQDETAGSPAPRVPSATITLDNGQVVPLDSPVLLGRDPSPMAVVPGGRPHPVEDAPRSISKTHLAVGCDGPGCWVVDLNSTNGSRIEGRAGSVRCVPWVRAPLVDGDVVRYGDRSLTLNGHHHG